MARARAQRKAVAWLAVLAAGLLLFAPGVSRMLLPASMAMAAMCGEHPHGDQHPDNSHHTDPLNACAYCALVAHGTLPLDAVTFSVPAIPSAPAAVLPGGRSLTTLAVERLPARGPPGAHWSLFAIA